jgi:hypothetical protein
VYQQTWDGSFSDGPQLFVIAIDDRADSRAAALRARAASEVATTVERHVVRAFDRGAWSSADLRAVVIHGSASDDASFVGPSDRPDLALVRERLDPHDSERFAEALASEIVSASGDATGGPPALVSRVERLLRLVRRRRPPSSAHEAALLDALPAHLGVGVAVIAPDDDPSATLPPEDLRSWPQLFVAIADSCGGPARPAIDGWGAALGAVHAPWPCGLGGGSGLFEDPWIDYACASPTRRVLTDANLGPMCLVRFAAQGLSACDRERGWTDPAGPDGVRRPASNEDGWRVCEVLPLEGAARSRCASSEECADCGSGWCVESQKSTCGLTPVRFVGGAMPHGIGGARLHIVCDLER